MQIFPISKEQLYIVKDLAYRIWPSAYASIPVSYTHLDVYKRQIRSNE